MYNNLTGRFTTCKRSLEKEVKCLLKMFLHLKSKMQKILNSLNKRLLRVIRILIKIIITKEEDFKKDKNQFNFLKEEE
jgi:hypothetical protein